MKAPRLGIIANTGKPAVADVLPDFFEWLQKRQIPFVVASDIVALTDISSLTLLPPDDVAEHSDFILSFGGDGTLLQTAHLIAPKEVPIIGVNMGGFGYLAEVGVEQLQQRMEDLLAGRYRIQNRTMLEARVPEDAKTTAFLGLNDVVMEKGGFPRLIRLETSVDGDYLNTFHADGLIVSTPTGSTGYSLSVGGPIVEPDVNALIINPISPHMLANRPVVIDGARSVEVVPFSPAGDYQLTVDGQRVMRPKSGTRVVVKSAQCKTRVVIFEPHSFHALLRNKLHWHDQLSAAGE
jgi:NAD+ kinase